MRRAAALTVLSLLALAAFTAPGSAKPDSTAPPDDQAPVAFSFVTPGGLVTGAITQVEVQFNPKEIAVDKAVPWGLHRQAEGDAPNLEFTSGKPHSPDVELPFDTYESGGNVSKLLAPLLQFLKVDPGSNAPPRVTIVWGDGLALNGTLLNFSVTYTLFLEDGTPVRAVMNTTWKEFSPAQEQTKGNPRH